MKAIIACTPSGGIGFQGKLPWDRIQGDLPRFKALTTGKYVFMGRKTWESLPVKPLPQRECVVVSKSKLDLPPTVKQIPTLENYRLYEDDFLIGGAQLINTNWHLITEIFLTRTITEYPCDVFIDLVKLEDEFTCRGVDMYPDHSYENWRRIE